MKHVMLQVTDREASLSASGRADVAEIWTSEQEEQLRLHVWETLREYDLAAYSLSPGWGM